jgi:DNA helicase HerA-like ATPase
MKLFTRETTVGIFRGFSEGGLEFHADLVLPYRNEFQSTPMHGQFLVVQLEDEDEAVLGRITAISSEGRLASSAGEDYGIRAVAEDRSIPEDLREQYLKYRVHMRVLGVLRNSAERLVFAASHRRLPHVGSKVAFLGPDLLREVAGHNIDNGAELGYLALGEFIYAGADVRFKPEPWMQVKSPCVIPKFRVLDLVARRTLVFARAGFGKSNLVKLLFANLYQNTPTVTKRGGRDVPVGSVIFDPDGEYFWPDDKNRPGLCDVPTLQDKVVVFTPKAGPSPFYDSFVAGDIRLDIRRLRPADVISIALPPEKQDQQNVRKLKGMNEADWQQLVDLVYRDGNAADGDTIKSLLRLEAGQQDAEMVAARANMTTIVRMLHDPASQMMDMLLAALRAGKLCIIDVSQMRGTPALVLSGLILRRIFDHNQQEFTKAQPQTIPVIAVLEEAQSVLSGNGSSGDGPYITWVKEGRKYDLGVVLITQQPGSISSEILSQGDNWFCFHLLSTGDLKAIKSANAHFSDDILSSLLNEPIPGHGVFWSSVGGKSYPIPIRVLSFEGQCHVQDPSYNRPAVRTAAQELRQRFASALASVRGAAHIRAGPSEVEAGQVPLSVGRRDEEGDADEQEDVLSSYEEAAIEAFRSDKLFLESLRHSGMTWRHVLERLKRVLPEVLSDRDSIAYRLVPKAMNAVFGQQDAAWKTEKRPAKTGAGYTTWIVVLRDGGAG